MLSSQWKKLLISACTEIFETCNATDLTVMEVDAGVVTEESALTFIGFTGPVIRGGLIVAAPLTMLRNLYPDVDPEWKPSDEDLRDWLGELTNQILGSIKNQLLAFDVTFLLGTPASLSVGALRSGSEDDNEQQVLVFRWEEWEFLVQFKVNGAALIKFRDRQPGHHALQ